MSTKSVLPIKILFLLTRSDTVGGSSIHVRDLCLQLMKTGDKPIVILGKNGYFADHLKELNITCHSIPELDREIRPHKDLKAYRKLKNIIQELKPDLISAHSSKIGFLGRYAAHSLKIPVLFTAHGWSYTDGKSFTARHVYRLLESYASKKTDKILCVSEFDRQIGIQNLPVASERFITVHNGMPDISPELYADPGKNGIVQIVMVARMDQPKDHMLLLDALNGLSGFHLHLVGDGPHTEKVKAKAELLQLNEKITFHGRSEQVKEILSDAQLFLLISIWEGFPRSTLESMRAGLPVIVSDVGGAAEAIEEGVTGYSVPRGDVKTLRDRLKLLIEDAKLREKMGKAGRKRYEEFFTFDQMFEKTYRIYEEVLSERKE